MEVAVYHPSKCLCYNGYAVNGLNMGYYSLIVWVSVVLRRIVVSSGDCCFDNLSKVIIRVTQWLCL